MARPTASLPLYLQMFGRALRVSEGKSHGIIIDHVSNVARHLLPDSPRVWSLDSRNKRQRAKRDEEAFPVSCCPECMGVFEAITATCPYCGHKPEPSGRQLPEQVDGDLCELDPEALKQMKQKIPALKVEAGLQKRLEMQGKGVGVSKMIVKRMEEKVEAQRTLRDTMAWWAGVGRSQGQVDAELYRRFYHLFGMDVLTAQALGTQEAQELTNKIRARIDG